jgi:hypothetical protein
MTIDERNLATLRRNIKRTLRKWKQEGTVGASVACLLQCTPTDGLTCTPTDYMHNWYVEAFSAARNLGFDLYD